MRLKTGHWMLMSATAVIVVLLLLAPHHLPEKAQITDEEFADEPPTVENDIDEALAIINGEAPMQGILKLRSIAEENPDNFRAQLHLGRFSAQTGQWEKVIERFDYVNKIEPGYPESDYWIGLAKFNLGEKEDALVYLERFLAQDENKELQEDALIMLNQIK